MLPKQNITDCIIAGDLKLVSHGPRRWEVQIEGAALLEGFPPRHNGARSETGQERETAAGELAFPQGTHSQDNGVH